MAKALTLLLALFTLSFSSVNGQFCQQLPQPSTIFENFSMQVNPPDQFTADRKLYHNCIAYDATSRNFRETTVTVQYITGSSVFSAQATYVCGETAAGSGTYAWAIGSVVSNSGIATNQSTETGCSNCRSTTAASTCTRKANNNRCST